MLITHGTLVTWENPNRVLTDHAIYIEEGVIRQIGPTAELVALYPQAEIMDAKGQWVMPGNICAHTHFYGAYARGMGIPGEPPIDFPAILTRLWWNLDKALDRDAVRASALVCLVDAIKHGTTTLVDHHASPNAIEGSLDLIAEAMTTAGLRGVLCYEVTDRDGMDKAEAGIAENVRFIQKYASHPRIRGTFGLHASLSLSDATLRKCRDVLPDSAGFHIHVAEHEADEQDSLEKYGMCVIPRLNQLGILGAKSIAAHCVHVDDDELAILKETGTWITHQPRSNMNNAVGAMAFDTMISQGQKLCLGNDGFSNVMWEDWKAAYFMHKLVSRDARQANGADIAMIATQNNARLVETFFPEKQLGQLIVGAQADMIFVNYQPFTPFTDGNLPWHILFGFEASMITTTIVDGVVLMRDRQLLTLDETEITRVAMELAPRVWERYQSYAQA